MIQCDASSETAVYHTQSKMRCIVPKRTILLRIFTIVSFTIVVFVQGCSLIGAGIGIAFDSSKPDSVSVSSWGVDSLTPGKDVTITLKNGTVYEGTFRELKYDSFQEYDERYNKYFKTRSSQVKFPKPLDSIIVKTVSRLVVSAQLLAYDYNCIYVRQTLGLLEIRYSHILDIEFSGKMIQSKTLLDWLIADSVPLRTTIVMSDNSAGGISRTVHLSEVYRIEYKNSKHAALTGFVIGAVFDVLFYATLHNAPIGGLDGLHFD
jgi:hypothetical protein